MPVLQDVHRRRRNALPALHEPALTVRTARLFASLAALVACTGAASDSSRAEPPTSEIPAGPTSRARDAAQIAGGKIECRISRISDGDSIHCGSAGRIRLLLIDAPELAQVPQGRDAKAVLEEILPVGTRVTVETDVRLRDSYDRILGYVFLRDGRMANEEMARSGYAVALVYPPNVRYVERIRSAVADARKAKRGLWATDFFECSPRDYRAGRCGSSQRERSSSGRRQSAGSS